MKKTLLLLTFFAATAISASAQITITSTDVATPLKTILQANDTMPTVTEGGAGISQTWNMTGLNSHSIDTLHFIPYAWAPNAAFSSANIVVQQNSDNVYSYLANNTSQLSGLGIHATISVAGSPITVTQINSPVEKVATFPFAYNTAYTNNYVTITPATYIGSAFPPADSIRSRSTIHKTLLVDAWGTLTTPLGTYSVIRSRETKVKHDTSDVHIGFIGWQNAAQTTSDSTTQYTYWANSVGFPLVTLTKDSLGGVSSATWLKALPTVGITEYTAPVQVNVYPNPAQNEINVETDPTRAYAVQIYDIMGRVVAAQTITSNISVINTSAYANGSYTFSILGKDKSVLNRGKFTVAK